MSSIREIVHSVAHLLPTQAPLDVFVHHNTLHAFEDRTFFDALEEAADIFGARPHLSIGKYLEAFRSGRIDDQDLMEAIQEIEKPSEEHAEGIRAYLLSMPGSLTRQQVQWRLREKKELDHSIDPFQNGKWFGAVARETARLGRKSVSSREGEVRSRELPFWGDDDRRTAHELVELVHKFRRHPLGRSLRALWIEALWVSAHLPVRERPNDQNGKSHRARAAELTMPLVTKLAARFLDRGMSAWRMPHSKEGFLKAALCYLTAPTYNKPWMVNGIEQESAKFVGQPPEAVIEHILKEHHVPESEWHSALEHEGLALKGWAGLMHRLEFQSDIVSYPEAARKEALIDFIAVKMIIERQAEKVLDRSGDGPGFPDLRPPTSNWRNAVYSRAYHLFHWCQLLGCNADALHDLHQNDRSLLHTLFTTWEERHCGRIWQTAFEKNFQRRAFTAFLTQATRSRKPQPSPRFQVVCCIDDREESFRRYLEELGDQFVTYGTAGFFGVDVMFQELGKEAAPYCPVVISPKHRIAEVVKSSHAGSLERSESFIHGAVALERSVLSLPGQLFGSWKVAIGGAFAFIPMAVRTLFPRLSHMWESWFAQKTHYDAVDVVYSRAAENAEVDAAEADRRHYEGFTLTEMTDRVAGVFKAIGLVENFAPVVTFIGHGSSSKNNPFKSAYDCGACGGRPGRVNARVFALMANRSDVRAALAERGIRIPESTHVLGAYHDTCSDSVLYFDQDRVPVTHLELLRELKAAIDVARARNADERCRRFAFASRGADGTALAYVEGRSHHIAEPRPEYGHATNAMCIVGRRALTKGLFLDRRSFLVSYDPTVDTDGSILTGQLRAVIPVCTGINLEYFFSALDNEKYGAGSKLPLNITALLGIITGYASDLRTGLPAQMVEIHEPVRLVTIIDAPSDRVLDTLRQLPAVQRLVDNDWFVLASFDAESGKLYRVLPGLKVAAWEPAQGLGKEVFSEQPLIAKESDNLLFFAIH